MAMARVRRTGAACLRDVPVLKSRLRRAVAAAATSAVMLHSAPLFAASGTWSGAADATWANAGNWSASPAPGTGDTATFNADAATVLNNTTIDLGTGVAVKTLLFD